MRELLLKKNYKYKILTTIYCKMIKHNKLIVANIFFFRSLYGFFMTLN